MGISLRFQQIEILFTNRSSSNPDTTSRTNKRNKMSSVIAIAIAAAPAAAAVEECMVCCEPYNKRSHVEVVCEYADCKYKVCIGCVRAYLITSINEPHCMQCNKVWSPDFQVTALKSSWMNGAYRQHRKQLLVDIEISKLPETMEAAARMKAINGVHKLLLTLYEQHTQIKHKYTIMRQQHPVVYNARGRAEINEEVKIIDRIERQELTHVLTQIAECNQRIGDLQHPYAGDADGSGKTEKRVFTMPCPANECKGMLSTQYKCGICELFACPECHEMIGDSKTAEHTCDPNNVASAQAIKKETKQCPGCPNRIYRIEGCSQMWCTGCHTAFDWNTGRVVKSQQLHNPHWVEYQRNRQNGEAPMRAPGDIPCGGIVSLADLRFIDNKILEIKKGLLKEMVRTYAEVSVDDLEKYNACDLVKTFLPTVYKLVEGVSRNDVRIIREQLQHEENFERERCLYILDSMTKDELAAVVYMKNVQRAKTTRVLHVYELFIAVGIDVFNDIRNSELTGMAFINRALEKMIELNALRLHCNGLFAQVSHIYNLSTPFLNTSWTLGHQKPTQKIIKEMLAEKAEQTKLAFVTPEWLTHTNSKTLTTVLEKREQEIMVAIADAEVAEETAKVAEKAIEIAIQRAKEASEYAATMRIRAENVKSYVEKAKAKAKANAIAASASAAPTPIVIE